MKRFLPVFIAVLLFLALDVSAQRPLFAIKGEVTHAFRDAKSRTLLVIRDQEAHLVVLLSPKMAVEGKWTLNGNLHFPDNDRFGGHIAFLDIGLLDTVTALQSIKLKFLSLASGEAVDAKVQGKPEFQGRWIKEGSLYNYGGKLFRFEGKTCKNDRVSSIPFSEVSPDRKFCLNAVIMRDGTGKPQVGIELENLENNDMLNIETFTYIDDGAPLIRFCPDAKCFYFRSASGPAFYDIKRQKTLNLIDIQYKNPGYFGLYLDNEKYLYAWDFYKIALVPRKSFELEELLPNPFDKSRIEVLAAEGLLLTGSLHDLRENRKDYGKLFRLNLKNSEYRTWNLPTGVRKIWMGEKGQAVYLYVEEGTLKVNEVEMQ